MINHPAIFALLQNAALLLAVVVIFDLVTRGQRLVGRPLRQAVLGVALGALGIGLILSSFRLENGIVFDTRSVLLGIVGLFLGGIPTVVAMLMTAAFRLWQGGAAAWPGAAVILASGGIGLAWRHYRRRPLADISWRELYAFGVVIHLVMLALMLGLPWETARRVLAGIGLPVLLIYPATTAFLGLLLANRLRRERAAAKLAESEERYRTLFENNHATMLIISPDDGAIVDANPAACRFYGWTREQLKQMRLGQINTLTPAQFQAEIDRAQANQKDHSLFKHRLADGSVRDVEVFSGPIRMSGRTLLYSIIHDVTERKRAETALAESEQLKALILESVDEGLHGLDAAGNIVFENSAALRMLGWPVERMLGQHAHALIHHHRPDGSEYPVTECPIYHTLRDGQTRHVEGELFFRQDGTSFPVEYTCCALRNEAGNITGAVVSFRDLTERLRAGQRLRESEQRLRRAIQDAPFPIMLHAEDGEILQLSQSWCDLTGYRREELQTVRAWTERAYGERQARVWEAIEATYRLEYRKHQGDFIIRTRTGEERVWDFSSAPLGRLPDGRRVVISMAVDVTEQRAGEQAERQSRAQLEASRTSLLSLIEDQREAEAQVRRLNEELEQRVRERTAQLQAANKELEAFTYSVSHDLRAPLRAINGYARILVEDHGPRLDADGQRVLGVIRDEALRMGALIDDLLQFSRLGRQALQIAPLDMTALVREVYDRLSVQAMSRAVDFQLAELPAAAADINLLRQVWSNLLDNALKYTRPRPRAVIQVSGVIRDGEVVYSVKDNGTGFDMKYANKLFGVFQRLHAADAFEGTGVGLALVQRLIHRHGGRIWAEAEPDRGAVFHFTLPLKPGIFPAQSGGLTPPGNNNTV